MDAKATTSGEQLAEPGGVEGECSPPPSAAEPPSKASALNSCCGAEKDVAMALEIGSSWLLPRHFRHLRTGEVEGSGGPVRRDNVNAGTIAITNRL